MYQYYAVTVCLVAEVVLLALLLLPLPRFMSQLVLNILRTTRIPFLIILTALMFFSFDQTMEMFRAEEKVAALPANAALDKDYSVRIAKFRTERNFYLCAFTTILLIILLRVQMIVEHKHALRREVEELKKSTKKQ